MSETPRPTPVPAQRTAPRNTRERLVRPATVTVIFQRFPGYAAHDNNDARATIPVTGVDRGIGGAHFVFYVQEPGASSPRHYSEGNLNPDGSVVMPAADGVQYFLDVFGTRYRIIPKLPPRDRMPPVTNARGQALRLRALGYDTHIYIEVNDWAMDVYNFQIDNALDGTGDVGDSTRDALGRLVAG